jgi:hypothetical protein
LFPEASLQCQPSRQINMIDDQSLHEEHQGSVGCLPFPHRCFSTLHIGSNVFLFGTAQS